MNQDKRDFTLPVVCEGFGLKRDAFYKFNKRYSKRLSTEKQVIERVQEVRKSLPETGVRKLHKELNEHLNTGEMKIGRDRLFKILREHNMLIESKKRSCKTTDSYHHFHKYGNLIKDLEITRPNQVWVADITYIRTVSGFCYLAIITDLFSRKIVGFDVSDSLELAGCLRAFSLAQKAARPAPGLIHHSDRGVQYCSHKYTQTLQNSQVLLSMTEENHCYENAVAERVNGILKSEFYLDQCFTSVKHARMAAENAIFNYNNKRLHMSLNYKTPNFVYTQNLA